MCDDDDISLAASPVTPDPFPGFTLYSIDYGRALIEAHVPGAIADAMVEWVKASPECRSRCSFEIYERDETTARIDGCVPLVVVETLLEMLAA